MAQSVQQNSYEDDDAAHDKTASEVVKNATGKSKKPKKWPKFSRKKPMTRFRTRRRRR